MTQTRAGQPVDSRTVEELIDQLAETEHALEELLKGQADAVLTPGGRMLLLRSAQERLTHDEEVQRCAAALQRGILDALPANIALLDRKGVIVSVNATWRQFALENGHAARDAAVGENYLTICEAVQGEEREHAIAAASGIRQVLAGARPMFSLEYPCHSPSTRRWFRMTATPLSDVAGGAVVMHLDVTERRLAEDAAVAGELRFRAILESGADVISLSDKHGQILFASPSASRVLGYDVANEILGRDLIDFIHPEDRESFSALFRRALTSSRIYVRGYARVRHRHGAWRVADGGFTNLLDDPAIGAVVGNFRDVTEEEEGRQALDRMFNLSLDMLSVVGFDGAFKRVNSAFERVLGYTEAEILSRPYMSFVHPDDIERTLQAGARLAAGEDISFFENRYRCHDGTDRWFQWACRSFPSEEIIYSVTRDVTEQKQAQLALEATQRRLVVASREAGMAEVASNVLHNVGNVLNGVNISAELVAGTLRSSSVANLGRVAGLLKEHAPDLPAYLATDPRGQQLPSYLELLCRHLADERSNALRELDSLRRSIDHIKEVIASQQDHARRGGVVASVAAAEIMEDALRITATALQLHGIRLVQKFEGPLQLRTDKHQVLQILVNLLRNACDALREMEPGGRVLTTQIGRVSEERLYFLVADDGPGIAPENLPRLFEHGFTTRKTGHGFGLHSAALLAQDLGGTLAVTSAGRGCGAAFRLELPLDSAKRNEEP
jgi:PAS domain S-box-containing protein